MFDVYQSVSENWRIIALLASIATAVKIIYDIWLGTNFITRVLSEPPIGWLGAAYKLAKAFVLVPSLLTSFGGRRLHAARYITELEILKPAGSKPNPHDYDPKEFEEILAKWRDKQRQRKDEIARLLKLQFSEDKPQFWGWLWWKIWTRAKPVEKGTVRTSVPIDDFPSLDDSRTLIKRYFDVLAAIGHKDRSFLSIAQIDAGYLAPLFLVTGLINRFADEDGWKLILENYRGKINDDTEYSVELRELRSFLFNCWLLWGPSVSPCSCKAWNAENDREGLIVQYGYGDENNSIDVMIRNGRSFSFRKTVADQLTLGARLDLASKYPEISIYAAPFSVKGHFRWGPIIPEREVSPAQKLIKGGTGDKRKPLSGRIVLDCDYGNVSVNDRQLSQHYYSAYIWIMFSVVNSEGNPFFDMPWKNLLPFFEHGNIAEFATFLTLKEALIAKVGSALTEMLTRPAKKGEAEVSIQYVCALDDSYCPDQGAVMFTPRSFIPGHDGRTKPEKLIEILKWVVGKDATLSAACKAGRLRLPSGDGAPANNDFASCRLPEIVEGFYQDLKLPEPLRIQGIVGAANSREAPQARAGDPGTGPRRQASRRG
jgi:hypothetical protein